MTRILNSIGETAGGWLARVESGSVQHLHDLDDPRKLVRTVRVMMPDSAAVALGSSQGDDVVDAVLAGSSGLHTARRRSGGGAVLIVPGQQVWIDFLVPRGDSLWDDDIVRAAFWVGELWRDVLVSVGVPVGIVHRGPLISSRWSSTVCFSGIGPGEVTAGGRKVMGLSQRRGRDWIRIQTIVHRIWDPGMLVSVLDLAESERISCLKAVAHAAGEVAVEAQRLIDSLMARLPD